jgi:hypothetical protein
LGEKAALRKTAPISSQTASNRLAKTLISTGFNSLSYSPKPSSIVPENRPAL